MIGRRAFGIGLGTLLLAGHALAEVKVNGKVIGEAARKPATPRMPLEQIPNHRQLMRDIVIALSAWARKINPQFIILVRGAPELLIKETREWDWESRRDVEGAAVGKYTPVGSPNDAYLAAIDGMLIDGLFYGHEAIDQPTGGAAGRILGMAVGALDRQGRRVLTIEYCRREQNRADAARKAAKAKTLTYVDMDRDRRLGHVPTPHPPQENAGQVSRLADARNFLPLLDAGAYASHGAWVAALADTNDDLLLLDAFWRGGDSLTESEIKALKFKRLGSRRLVLADLPIGRARRGRYYWQADWQVGNPNWLAAAAPDDANEFIVEYWNPAWKAIIGKYMEGLLHLGFDGILFDAMDAYLYFESLMPLK